MIKILHDPRLSQGIVGSRVLREFGPEGYGRLWLLKECMAEETLISLEQGGVFFVPILSGTEEQLCARLQCDTQFLDSFLATLQELAVVEIERRYVTIYVHFLDFDRELGCWRSRVLDRVGHTLDQDVALEKLASSDSDEFRR